MGVRAVARAETARPPIATEKNDKKSNFINHFYWRSSRAQPRARPCSARQSILLIKEILFDYLIDSVAQKLVKLESVENNGKIENFQKIQKFSKFSNFLTFCNFSIVFNKLYFFKFLSYAINQVVKKYLLDQENRLACTTWARARLRAR